VTTYHIVKTFVVKDISKFAFQIIMVENIGKLFANIFNSKRKQLLSMYYEHYDL